MRHVSSIAETCEQILRREEPNFLRLYLNPHVAQTCFCLDRYVRTTWTEPSARAQHQQVASEECQTFLANGLEEASVGPSNSRTLTSTGSGFVQPVFSSTPPIGSPALFQQIWREATESSSCQVSASSTRTNLAVSLGR